VSHLERRLYEVPVLGFFVKARRRGAFFTQAALELLRERECPECFARYYLALWWECYGLKGTS
jgi:hypothetical protein